MGSWNGTCFFSGLSILEDDPAVIVPMVVGAHGCIAAWFPIHGRYDDYGGLKDIKETPLTERLVSLVKKYGKHGHKGPTPFKDSARLQELSGIKDKTQDQVDEHEDLMLESFKHADKEAAFIRFGGQWEFALGKGKEIEGIHDLVNVMERQGCRSDTLMVYAPYDQSWEGIQFVMVHGKVWAHLMRNLADNELESGTSSGSGLLNKILKDYVFKGDGGKKPNPALKEYFDTQRYQNFRRFILGGVGSDSPYQDIFGKELWEGMGWSLNGLKGHALKAASEMFYFQLACNTGRRALAPQAGAGSQSENFEFTRDLAQVTLDICNETIKRRGEDC